MVNEGPNVTGPSQGGVEEGNNTTPAAVEGVANITEGMEGGNESREGSSKNESLDSGENGEEVVEGEEDGGVREEEGETVEEEQEGSAIGKRAEVSIEGNKTWHYQLQDLDKESLKALPVPILVIDPDEGLSCEDVVELRENKTVLAYLSIGEAEDYRDYWDSVRDKPYIREENPEWEGNYLVEYWNEEWQELMVERAKELAECYDGLYLDKVDSYEAFDRPEDMVAFVERIAEEAKAVNPSLLIVPQNGLALYRYPSYREVVDGLAAEDVWWYDDERTEAEEREERLSFLRQALGDGKLVLVVDYPQRQEHIREFYRECWGEGFYCTVENRELNLSRPIPP